MLFVIGGVFGREKHTVFLTQTDQPARLLGRKCVGVVCAVSFADPRVVNHISMSSLPSSSPSL